MKVKHGGPFLLVNRDLEHNRCSVVQILGRMELGCALFPGHPLEQVPDSQLGVVADLTFSMSSESTSVGSVNVTHMQHIVLHGLEAIFIDQKVDQVHPC